MPYDKDQILVAAAVLYRTVTSQQSKLQWGIQHRAETRARERAGEEVRNSRTEWLVDTQGMLLELLRFQAVKYAEKNPHDCISTLDFEDVLLRILDRLRARVAQETEKKTKT